MSDRKLIEKISPLFFGLYPLLALYAGNQNYVRFPDILRSVFFTLAGMGIGWLLFRWLTKSWEKAGVLVSLTMGLFFSYGHVYLAALERFGEGFSHLYLLILYLVIGTAGGILVIWKMKKTSPFPRFLGVVGAVLLGMLAIQIGWYQFQVWQGSTTDNTETVDLGEAGVFPDVYLIILDAHTRSDVLLRAYDLDNSEFIANLEDMGFYVSDCSQSNYPNTDMTLLSLFNMDYVHEFLLVGDVLPGLRGSSVKSTFDQNGYITFAFNNYFSSHYDLNEDERLQRQTSITEKVNVLTGLNEYESLVVETSTLRLMVDFQYLLGRYFGELFSDQEQYFSHYLETLFILDELKRLPERSERKFVFAHIAVPHWPFVFSEAGEYEHVWGLDSIEGYRKNVVFIEDRIQDVVAEIIAKSEAPPVIILMGDHGPTGEGVLIQDRISNLYSVLADEEVLSQLSPTSTPVNTFRLIFNHYFGAEYPLLTDTSYKIWNNEGYNLDEVLPNLCVSE